jgi:Sap, sulfolipid-1-addressing protein
VSSDLVSVFLLSLLAMFNPTLLAAVTVMLLLPNPKRLMLGYLLGAYTTSITLGLVIVHSIQGSSFENTSRSTISPAEDIAVGVILLLVAYALASGRDEPLRARRARRKEEKSAGKEPKEPWVQRMLGRGSARITFVLGLVLSFPGVSYLDALDHIAKLDPGVVPTVLLVIYFCVMQQLLLELPLLGYVFAPEKTQARVVGFRAWIEANGRRAAIIGAAVLAILLIVRGLATLL